MANCCIWYMYIQSISFTLAMLTYFFCLNINSGFSIRFWWSGQILIWKGCFLLLWHGFYLLFEASLLVIWTGHFIENPELTCLEFWKNKRRLRFKNVFIIWLLSITVLTFLQHLYLQLCHLWRSPACSFCGHYGHENVPQTHNASDGPIVLLKNNNIIVSRY